MRAITLTLMTLMLILAHAETTEVQPTLPWSDLRDYTQPGYIIEDDIAYPTLPGTSVRDYTQPGYLIIQEQEE